MVTSIKSEVIDVDEDCAMRNARAREQPIILSSDDDIIEIASSRSILERARAAHDNRTSLSSRILARASSTYCTFTPTIRPRRLNTSISLLDLTLNDDDDEEDEAPRRSKKPRLTAYLESDEEYNSRLSLNNQVHWAPIPVGEEGEDQVLQDETKLPPFVTQPVKWHPRVPGRSRSNYHQGKSLSLPWNTLRAAICHPTNHVLRYDRHNPCKPNRLTLAQSLGLDSLQATSCEIQTSGAINKILQIDGKVIACSAALAGWNDTGDEVRNRENQPGSLAVMQHGQMHHPPEGQAHERLLSDSNGPFTKYYTVNDISICPIDSSIFVSSGQDSFVRVWKLDEEPAISSLCVLPSNRPGLARLASPHIPHVVTFKPNSDILAAAYTNGVVQLYSPLNSSEPTRASSKLQVAPSEQEQAVGAIIWGSSASSDLLVASTEPGNEYQGYHRAFDVKVGRLTVEFNATESGDALCLHPTGDSIALVTTSTSQHHLRIFDVRRQEKDPTMEMLLEPMVLNNSQDSGEVNCLIYSPDGVYLAVARNDTSTHVYDSRMLTRGPLHQFHHSHGLGTHSASFGTIHAEWLETHSSRLTLLTGGDDGHVRCWDPLQSDSNPNNGASVASSNWELSHFAVGDRSKDKYPLITGDIGGHLTAYNFM